MYNALIISVVIITPPGQPSTWPFCELQFHLPAIREIALQWELIDPRETHIFVEMYNFYNDSNIIRQRYQCLKNAPSIKESAKFLLPTQIHMDQNRIAYQFFFNRSMFFKSRPQLHEYYKNAANECNEIHKLFWLIQEANKKEVYLDIKRTYLLKYKNIIGNELYYQNYVPPPAPYQYFQITEK